MWKAGSLVLGLVLLGVLAYDINLHGSFDKSSTNKFLKDTGALHYGDIVLKETKKACDKSVVWMKINVPVYYNETCVYLKPYMQLFYEIGLIAYNSSCSILWNLSVYIEEKSPIVQSWLAESSIVVQDGFSKLSQSALVVKDQVQNCSLSAIEYARKNIFVGSMSPENLRKVTLEALNTTQVYATNTFQWVYEKFQSLSRLD